MTGCQTLLRAATGSAIMGVDQWGTITFFSAGAEQVLGYTAAEVIGIRSITTSSTRRRSKSAARPSNRCAMPSSL